MQKFKNSLIALSILLLCTPVVTSKAGYLIFSDVVASSGCEAKSDSFLLGFSVAQPVIGLSSDSVYVESAGFWHWRMPWPVPDLGVKSQPSFELSLPKEYSLSQNFPNPFNPVTSINYSLPEAVYVKLEIYNILGQKVRTLVDKPQVAGYKTVRWDGRDKDRREMASGVYFYRLEAGRYSSTKKLLLLK